MSLRDTIEGARDEAKVTVDAMAKKSKDGSGGDKAVPAYDPFKSGKSSAAGARPAREAAASVRMEGDRTKKNPATMTKEEKKAARAEERRLEDKRNTAYDYMLKDNPEYKATNKTWWILLGVGFAMTIVSLIFTYVLGNGGMGLIALIALVLAYAFIIAAFVYDFRKRRKFRKAAEKRLQGMNDKRVAEYVKEQNEKARAEQAEQEAAKAAKKAAKGK
ncbi:APC family permease [Paratractidigestivibacter sp.]|uniref:APC family permease n=1 Tax=Paratractidigestivibacter sp. TaxID=2847316 RepID=UPI002ABDF16A|nr:APC family permease [Paratractidigestivibacter sp.]